MWRGQLKSEVKSQIPELSYVNLNKVMGIRFQDESFSNGNKSVFIQCVFKYTEEAQVAKKVIGLCKSEVRAEIEKYYHQVAVPNTSRKS